MLITVVDSVGMQASEIRDTILSEMSIRISAMQTEADIKQILDLIGLDCAVDKINKIVKFHSDAEHCFAILEKLQQAGDKFQTKRYRIASLDATEHCVCLCYGS